MTQTQFIVDLLTQWVLTGGNFDDMLHESLAAVSVDVRERWSKAAKSDFAHLQQADLKSLRKLRGNPERLSDEIAGILRWQVEWDTKPRGERPGAE